MQYNSLSTTLPELIKLFTNALESFEKVNTAATTDEEAVTVNIEEPDGSINKITIPSFGYLKNSINRLENNIKAISNLDGNGSTLRLSDGTYRKLLIDKLPSEALDITEMQGVSEFNIKSNWFFENLISPLLYVSFDVTDQIAENTERVLVDRYILDCNTATKETLFDTTFKGKSNISFDDFQKILLANSIHYILDEEIVDIPIRHKQYYGNFDVLKISNIEKTEIVNGKEIASIKKLYKLNKLTYSDINASYEDTMQLKVGDSLDIINEPVTTRYIIKSIDSSTNSVILELVEGYEGITIGTDIFKVNTPNNAPINIDVTIGYNERCVVFMKPIDADSNMPAINWSPGCGFFTNELSTKDTLGNEQTLDKYYRDSVLDFGAFLLSCAEDFYPTVKQGIIPDSPVLYEDNFEVVLINAHVAESNAVKQLKQLNNQKNELENRLKELDTTISSSRTKLQTKNYSTEVEKDSDKNTLNGLITERNSQAELYRSVVNEILSKSKDSSIESAKPKYRIRGFWEMPAEKYSPETGNQAIIKFKTRYRYLDTNGAANPLNQFEYQNGNIRTTATFSNYVIEESVLRHRTKNSITGRWQWDEIQDTDPEAISINRLDIPITKGEQVEIQVKSISEAGYPGNCLESEWSDPIVIEFPADMSSFNEIEDIIKQNKEDLTKIALEQDLESKGILKHVETSFSTNDNYFAHNASNIASGFVSENQVPIDMFTKLAEMQAKIDELTAALMGLQGEIVVSLVDSEGNVTPISKNSCTEVFAGYYSDDVKQLDDPRGAIISKTYYINISNAEDTPLRLISKFSGNRTVKVDNSIVANVKQEDAIYYTANTIKVSDDKKILSVGDAKIEQRSIFEDLAKNGLIIEPAPLVQGSVPKGATIKGANDTASIELTRTPVKEGGQFVAAPLTSPLENKTIFAAAVKNVFEEELNDKINLAFKQFKEKNDNNFEYVTVRRYDQVPVLLTNPTDVENHKDVKKISPYQSPQCKNQFIYARYKDVSSGSYLYANGMIVNARTGERKYEYNIGEGAKTKNSSMEWRPAGSSQGTGVYTGKGFLGVHINHPLVKNNQLDVESIASAYNIDITNLSEEDIAKLIFKESVFAVGDYKDKFMQNEFIEPTDDNYNNSCVKICFDVNDQYLLGEYSCGCYLFLSPIDHEYMQVDGDSKTSYKSLKSGSENSINIPVTFQYRMTDYYGQGSGKNGGLGNVNGILVTQNSQNIKRNDNANPTYKKKIGIDIYTGTLNNPTVTQFDLEFSAKYKQDTFTLKSFSNTKVTDAVSKLEQTLKQVAPSIRESKGKTTQVTTGLATKKTLKTL